MSTTTTNKRTGDQFLIRLPAGMRQLLSEKATRNKRPMSAEVIEAISQHLEAGDRTLVQLQKRLIRLERAFVQVNARLLRIDHKLELDQ